MLIQYTPQTHVCSHSSWPTDDLNSIRISRVACNACSRPVAYLKLGKGGTWQARGARAPITGVKGRNEVQGQSPW